MNTIKFILVSTLIPFLTGCSEILDKKLDEHFPLNQKNDGQAIIVSGTVPINTEPKIRVQYTSKKCTSIHLNSDFIPTGRDQWNTNKEWDVQYKDNNRFETRMPLNGGGWCDWKLTNMSIGLIYTQHPLANKQTKFLVSGILSVYINDMNKSRYSSEKDIENKIDYSPDFHTEYEEYIGKYSEIVFLSPKGDSEYRLWLHSDHDGYINYSPKLNSSKIRKSFQDKENKWIEYPNGEIKYEKK
ncbi:hypothetical protein [Xenorhabdus bovienii]|uniref:hypothetical protein n=1 Tax=Xenorhabdus bovienii TaxID=40576 RepID=UPI0023B24AF1|nr:hypothetical protein [Xenorhabdus bovienii]MDE9431977.1 hypothetical protein [Xenorhabdus bovienii]MDE9489703.1 hypothetical protein [Xenorhabdus bovienii]MDE9505977.1 hypothetical protein [Xenorhabdus bovienii]MDE9547705.1 hypothetical protein [Xenorhabdus bovienii]